jgi:glycine dehydrogenase subunit 2
LKKIVQEAENTPELLLQAPVKTKVRRLDETMAARKPCLAG